LNRPSEQTISYMDAHYIHEVDGGHDHA